MTVTGAAIANETWKFVEAKSKQAMKQVLGIRDDEKARMKHEGDAAAGGGTPSALAASK